MKFLKYCLVVLCLTVAGAAFGCGDPDCGCGDLIKSADYGGVFHE